MISVVIPTLNDEARLVDCLTPLIPAAVEGLVRELVVVDAGSTDRTLAIADDAGAVILSGGGLSAGVAAAKGPWLLLLDPGVRLEAGWQAAAEKHINGPRGTARFRLRRAGAGWLGALQRPKALANLVLKAGAGGDHRLGGDDRALRALGGRLLDAVGWL